MEKFEWLLVTSVKLCLPSLHMVSNCSITIFWEVMGYWPPSIWISKAECIQQDCQQDSAASTGLSGCSCIPLFASRGWLVHLSDQGSACLFCPQPWLPAQPTGAWSPPDLPGIWLRENMGLVSTLRGALCLQNQLGDAARGGKGEEKVRRSFLCVSGCWSVHLQRAQQRKGLTWEIVGFSFVEAGQMVFSVLPWLVMSSCPDIIDWGDCPFPEVCHQLSSVNWPHIFGCAPGLSLLFLWPLTVPFLHCLVTVASQCGLKSVSFLQLLFSFAWILWLFGVLCGSLQMLGWFVLSLWKRPLVFW